jgi:Sec-independent protein translocase protein TatA
MEFLNIGVWELFFILLLAFIVLGPQKAIKTAGEIGRWVRELMDSSFWQEIVSTSHEIRDLPKKVMDDETVQRTIADLDRSTKDVAQRLHEMEKDVSRELSQDSQKRADEALPGDPIQEDSPDLPPPEGTL